MWKLRRKKSVSETDERTFPAEKEFWLVRGAFREWQADRSGQGYYGLCDCWAEAVCPPGERPCQDRFYRLVYGLMERMLQSAPAMVLIEDLSRSDNWARQKARFKQLALDSGGAVLEEMGKWKDCCAFVFSEMPGSFLRDVYWWMAEHGCGEEVYAQYSVLEHMDTEMTVSALREKTRLDILVDDTHPVLLLQLAPTSSLAPVDVGAHQRPQLGELVRIPADFAGDGGLAQLPGGHHPAVSADDAPCVLAVGRDHDVLQKAVLLHGAHGGKELIVLRHGEAVHGVIHQRRHGQLAGQLTVDGAGVFRGLLQGGEDGGAFFTCHGSALHSCQHFVAQGGVIAGGGAAGGEEAQGLEGQRGLLHVDILADVRLEGQTRQHGGEVGDHFPVKAGAGLHGGHEDAQGPDVRVGDLTDGLDGLQHDVVALDGVFIHLDGDEDVLNGHQHVDIEQALQRGGAVEKHEIVSIGDLGQEAAQGGVPAKGHLLHGGQRRSQQTAAPDQVEVFGSGVADGVRQRGGGDLRQGQVAGGVALSIHVHDQNLFALECKSEVNILWKENCRRYPSKCVLEAYNR